MVGYLRECAYLGIDDVLQRIKEPRFIIYSRRCKHSLHLSGVVGFVNWSTWYCWWCYNLENWHQNSGSSWWPCSQTSHRASTVGDCCYCCCDVLDLATRWTSSWIISKAISVVDVIIDGINTNKAQPDFILSCENLIGINLIEQQQFIQCNKNMNTNNLSMENLPKCEK